MVFLPIEQKEKGNKGLCYEKEMNKLKDQKWKDNFIDSEINAYY